MPFNPFKRKKEQKTANPPPSIPQQTPTQVSDRRQNEASKLTFHAQVYLCIYQFYESSLNLYSLHMEVQQLNSQLLQTSKNYTSRYQSLLVSLLIR